MAKPFGQVEAMGRIVDLERELAGLRELLRMAWRIARVNAKLVTKARLAVLDASPLGTDIRAALGEE